MKFKKVPEVPERREEMKKFQTNVDVPPWAEDTRFSKGFPKTTRVLDQDGFTYPTIVPVKGFT